MISYEKKLTDPRWQRKRLEILDRDFWTCQFCSDTKTQLDVHHKEYIKGLEPWEYLNDLLITVCNPCHQEIDDLYFAKFRADDPIMEKKVLVSRHRFMYYRFGIERTLPERLIHV